MSATQSKKSSDWITPMYRKAVKKILVKLEDTPAKGYWSQALGSRIDGQREVLKSLQSINATYTAIAQVHGIKLNLVEVDVDDDPFEDALAEV